MELLENEPLARYTSYAIGGSARWFVSVKDVSEMKDIVRVVCEKKVPYYVIGGGSNTLVSDKGFDGLVIKMDDRSITIDGERVTAACGAPTAQVSHAAVQKGLTGFEWAFGIPGTIGGAVRGNAGAFGGSIADILVSADVIDPNTGTIETMTNGDFHFRYRWSSLAEKRMIILRAHFQLSQSTVEECRKKLKSFLDQKKERQPLGAHCAGSTFKNIVTASLNPHQIPKGLENSEKIHAAWLMDQAGLKGVTAGDAQISEKHANFIINRGNASSHDVCTLIALAKQKVRERFSLDLEEEIRYLGSDKTTY